MRPPRGINVRRKTLTRGPERRGEGVQGLASARIAVVFVELGAVELVDAGELVHEDVKTALARRRRRLRGLVVAKARRPKFKRAAGLRGKHRVNLDSLFPFQSKRWTIGQIRRCTPTEHPEFPAKLRYFGQWKRPPRGVKALTQQDERVAMPTENARIGRRSDNRTPSPAWATA